NGAVWKDALGCSRSVLEFGPIPGSDPRTRAKAVIAGPPQYRRAHTVRRSALHSEQRARAVGAGLCSTAWGRQRRRRSRLRLASPPPGDLFRGPDVSDLRQPAAQRPTTDVLGCPERKRIASPQRRDRLAE